MQLSFVQATVISSTITSQHEIFREIPIVCFIVITNQIWIFLSDKVNDRRTLRSWTDFAVHSETGHLSRQKAAQKQQSFLLTLVCSQDLRTRQVHMPLKWNGYSGVQRAVEFLE
jgi:hypothetical protein